MDRDRSSFFVALVVVDVLAGLADAVSGPYLVLFLVDHVGLTPLMLSGVLTIRALSGIAFGAAFGAWIERRTSVTPLLLALAGSALGYGLLAFTTDFAFVLAIAAVPIAIGGAAFSRSIALVKRNFARANLYTANRAIGVMRASWSLAWAFGPAIGAAVVAVFGFRGVFLTSAGAAVLALTTLALLRVGPDSAGPGHAIPRKAANGRTAIALAFTSLALFHTAMFMGSIPLAIVLTTSLGGAQSDVGWAYSLCAALEIVVMGALVWRPLRGGERNAIAAGFAVFVAYFVALALARSVLPFYGLKSSGRLRSRSSLISGSVSCNRSCRTEPAPPRRCFRTPVKWAPCSPPGRRRPRAEVRLRVHLRCVRHPQRRRPGFGLPRAIRTGLG